METTTISFQNQILATQIEWLSYYLKLMKNVKEWLGKILYAFMEILGPAKAVSPIISKEYPWKSSWTNMGDGQFRKINKLIPMILYVSNQK